MVLGNTLLDPVLRPLLSISPLLSIIIISLFISLIITLVYKLVTDQKKMKEFKDEIKVYQDRIKQHKDDQKKMMEIQKKAMEKNMQYMKHSLKPTLFTMLPIILIFGWLNANMGYYPLAPDQEFSVVIEAEDVEGISLTSVPELDYISKPLIEGGVSWTLKGTKGEYLLEFEKEGQIYQKNILITDERRYEQPIEKVSNSFLNRIEILNEPVIYLKLGTWKIGWFGTYIIFSLLFSTLLRKLLKVY